MLKKIPTALSMNAKTKKVCEKPIILDYLTDLIKLFYLDYILLFFLRLKPFIKPSEKLTLP